MADLGAIGVRGNKANPAVSFDFAAFPIKQGSVGSIGALRGITLGGPTSYFSDGTFGRHLQVGVTKNTTEGSPSQPSLQLDIPGFWRFRWVVKTGSRTISVLANQNSTGSIYRPSLVVKANANVGLTNDISGSAPDGTGWMTIGPVAFSATGTDVVWVELWNNNYQLYNTPALFDHITVT